MIVMNNIIRKLATTPTSNSRNVITNVSFRRQFKTATMMTTMKTTTPTTTLPPTMATVSPLFIQTQNQIQPQSQQLTNSNNEFVMKHIPEHQATQRHWFSSSPTATAAATTTTTTTEPGFVQKPLEALDMALVRQIKAELMEVDANSDGRLDPEELKELLRKHSDAFTDEEIVELGELYYSAKAGGSVRFDKFIEAVDRVVAGVENNQTDNNEVKYEDKAEHFRTSGRHPLGVGRDGVEFVGLGKSHGHYTDDELDVKLTHVEPKDTLDRMAYNAVKMVRVAFDSVTGWKNDNITINNILNRTIYLETIAAVPGMVAAIVRHFKSLRTMKADGGYLQLFLEEANNERMHLLTFVRMKDPGYLFRGAVILGQFGFGLGFTTAYIISPKFCHRFVGYVEEEACSTYTKIIKAIENAEEGTELAAWKTQPPPQIAVAYWKLGKEGTVLDLMKAVRADEAEHRDVNHLISGVKEGQVNPLYDPESKLDLMLTKYVKNIMKRGSD